MQVLHCHTSVDRTASFYPYSLYWYYFSEWHWPRSNYHFGFQFLRIRARVRYVLDKASIDSDDNLFGRLIIMSVRWIGFSRISILSLFTVYTPRSEHEIACFDIGFVSSKVLESLCSPLEVAGVRSPLPSLVPGSLHIVLHYGLCISFHRSVQLCIFCPIQSIVLLIQTFNSSQTSETGENTLKEPDWKFQHINPGNREPNPWITKLPKMYSRDPEIVTPGCQVTDA